MLTNLKEGRKVSVDLKQILQRYIDSLFIIIYIVSMLFSFTFQLKCAQYWPASNATMSFENVVLTAIVEQHYAYYVIRKMKLTHKKVSQNTLVSHDYSDFIFYM